MSRAVLFLLKAAFLFLLKAVLFLLLICGACGPFSGLSMNKITNLLPLSQGSNLDYYAEYTFSDYSVVPPKVYHEKLWHAADGKYRIECSGIFELIGQQLVPCPQSELDGYNQLLTQGWGYFVVNERGFRIRNPEYFLENYNYAILNPHEPYLDRTALVTRITTANQDRPNYTVWHDRDCGLPLKYIEDTLTTDPLSVMEMTQLDMDPDFTGIDFYDFPDGTLVESLSLEDMSNFGFSLFYPVYIPDGFHPLTPQMVEISGIQRIRIAYTDGIQEIVISEVSLLEIMKKSGNPSVIPSLSPKNLVNVVLGNDSKAGLHATHFTIGLTRLVVRSIIHEEEIASMIDSLAPLN